MRRQTLPRLPFPAHCLTGFPVPPHIAGKDLLDILWKDSPKSWSACQFEDDICVLLNLPLYFVEIWSQPHARNLHDTNLTLSGKPSLCRLQYIEAMPANIETAVYGWAARWILNFGRRSTLERKPAVKHMKQLQTGCEHSSSSGQQHLLHRTVSGFTMKGMPREGFRKSLIE